MKVKELQHELQKWKDTIEEITDYIEDIAIPAMRALEHEIGKMEVHNGRA